MKLSIEAGLHIWRRLGWGWGWGEVSEAQLSQCNDHVFSNQYCRRHSSPARAGFVSVSRWEGLLSNGRGFPQALSGSLLPPSLVAILEVKVLEYGVKHQIN